jgi:hypothetical protein
MIFEDFQQARNEQFSYPVSPDTAVGIAESYFVVRWVRGPKGLNCRRRTWTSPDSENIKLPIVRDGEPQLTCDRNSQHESLYNKVIPKHE